MDEELKQLDLAIAEARALATEALSSLRAPQVALRAAAAGYIESVAQRRVDASRRASVAVMAQLSDDEIVELRFWAEEQVALVRSEVESDIESCDFWIPEMSGLSLTDVSNYAVALVPRPKDSRTGIPQTLVLLFERCLDSLRHGLGVVGLSNTPVEAEPRIELALVRAWRVYREMAIDCIMDWADIDDRYQTSSARFQEMRWEIAGQADFAALRAQLAAEDADTAEDPVAAEAPLAAASAVSADIDDPLSDVTERLAPDPMVRTDSESLIPVSS